MAEDVGREVEQWLSKQQGQSLQGVVTCSASSLTAAKFYISFDGTGVPVRKNELLGQRGKQADGSARTREVKFGCVFTQVGMDKEGYPKRDLRFDHLCRGRLNRALSLVGTCTLRRCAGE